jgi:hypothetical protein
MSSSNIGTLTLGTRLFYVKRATVSRQGQIWAVEIETECEEYDSERWEPLLYHQGLLIDAFEDAGPQGIRTSWASASDEGYPHPEAGYMYVFGHHDIRSSIMTFGTQTGRTIELRWSGQCDVFWDDEFSKDVPFDCICTALVNE